MKITRETMTKDDLIKQAVKEYFDQKRKERSKPKKQGFFAKIFGGSKK